jgi:hypothetical protein
MGDFAQLIGVFAQFWLKNLLACALLDEVRTFIRQADLSIRRAYEENENLFANTIRNCVPCSSRRCGTEEGQ